MERLKILVVDDDHRHLAAAREQLESEHDLVVTDSYEEAVELLRPGTDIQVFLIDLLMPAEPYALGGKGVRYIGQSTGIGTILVFRAAAVKVKWIVCLTDMSHHDHPMSAAVDWISPAYVSKEYQRTFRLNDSIVLIAHAPLDSERRKNWKASLEVVLSETK